MNDAESGQRGYLLTHRESYLEPYERAVAESHDQLKKLRQMTADNPAQQKNLDLLEPLVNVKFSEMAQTVALERNSDHGGALKIVLNDSGKNAMDQIRAILNQMHESGRGLLEQREAAYQEAARRNSELSGAIIVLGVGFIKVIFFLLRRMERMQEMIKICAWSKLIEYEGAWLSMEEYLERRFKFTITHGMSDAEAKKMRRIIEEETEGEVARVPAGL